MPKLLNIAVLVFWVIAQTITAANSGTHVRHHGTSTGYTAHSIHHDHAAQHASVTEGGHAATHAGGAPCPETGQAAPESNGIAGDCCDHANCHVADVVHGAVAVTGQQLAGFGVVILHPHSGWSPASPLPPPNPLA